MAHILVIEDEFVLFGLISSTLRLEGHTIIEASDPMDALSIVDKRIHEIDLVLTDVEMNPISGLEFVKRIGVGLFYDDGQPIVNLTLASVEDAWDRG